MRIVVAMSGGVDSSVAAALLVEAGHEVVGLSMQLYDQREGQVRFGSCCTLDDLHDARRVASALGVPHYVVNFQDRFEQEVIGDFVREYAAGRTPIPCIHCNGQLKFASLVERARGLEANQVATGHYARVSYDAGRGHYRLYRGADTAKDQSYFLFSLDQAQLTCANFPVGSLTKDAVRAHARRLGLPVADKPDSHEICFVPSGDYAEFVERRAPGVRAAGVFRDLAGRVVGVHDGVYRFTVGQRKGLGLSGSAPLYVLELDASTQTAVVGPRAALERTRCTASRVNWIDTPPATPTRLAAQVRYRHRAAPALVTPVEGDRVDVEFAEPQAAIAAGQAIVLYEDDAVVGGGWID
jgi:tRNA-specific 2-thiouridylase